jgi:hypothetical protein
VDVVGGDHVFEDKKIATLLGLGYPMQIAPSIAIFESYGIHHYNLQSLERSAAVERVGQLELAAAFMRDVPGVIWHQVTISARDRFVSVEVSF